ncbi:MAG TPA: acylphosphatase [Bauldia sp.]|nr:acylphosphatase [Bauldia sp.]
MASRAVHLVVRGHVQGVGFRAFVEREAVARRLAGWVRNRREGTVEAVFIGPAAAIDSMLAACRQGPPAASVAAVETADYTGPPLFGFGVVSTPARD